MVKVDPLHSLNVRINKESLISTKTLTFVCVCDSINKEKID